MTLGSAAATHLRLVVWCKDCRYQAEPDLAEMSERYGAETTVRDWAARLVCGQCGAGGSTCGERRAVLGIQVFFPQRQRLDDMAVVVEHCEVLGRHDRLPPAQTRRVASTAAG